MIRVHRSFFSAAFRGFLSVSPGFAIAFTSNLWRYLTRPPAESQATGKIRYNSLKLGGFIEQLGKTEGPDPRTLRKKHPFVGQPERILVKSSPIHSLGIFTPCLMPDSRKEQTIQLLGRGS